MVRDARKWKIDSERTASEFDAGYYGGLLGKAVDGGGVCFFKDESKLVLLFFPAWIQLFNLQSSFGFMFLAQYRNGVSTNETITLSINEVT